MKTTVEATDYIHDLNIGCERLNAVCNRSQFREGDFMEAVKLVAGMLYYVCMLCYFICIYWGSISFMLLMVLYVWLY